MKQIINEKIKSINKKIDQIELSFRSLEEKLINGGMYSTEKIKFVEKIIILGNKVEKLKPEILKIEEATCRLLKKW